MRQCREIDYERIIAYIGDDYYKCLYLYLDLKKYGFNNSNVDIFIEEKNDHISCLLLKYFNSLHLFSKDNDYDQKEIINYILRVKPTMICGEKNIIENLSLFLKDFQYESQYGFIRGIDKIESNDFINIVEAKESDFFEITNLLMTDKNLSGTHTFNSLYHELITRFKEGYCKNYYIKNNDVIIGHISSGAEDEKIAILTNLIIKEEYRGLGYGRKLCESFCQKMINEGKRVYLVSYTTNANKLYDKLGFKIYTNWGKLYLNRN